MVATEASQPGRRARIAGVASLMLYPLILLWIVEVLDGQSDVRDAAVVAAVVAWVFAWLGWRWPFGTGVVLCIVGVILLLPMLMILSWSEGDFITLTAAEKLRSVIVFMPPLISGIVLLVAGSQAKAGTAGPSDVERAADDGR